MNGLTSPSENSDRSMYHSTLASNTSNLESEQNQCQ